MSRKDIENVFDNVDKTIDSLKSIVNAELSQLEVQSEFKPIKKMQELYLKSCSIKENDSGQVKNFRMYVPKECIKILNQNKELQKIVGKKRNYTRKYTNERTLSYNNFLYNDSGNERDNRGELF